MRRRVRGGGEGRGSQMERMGSKEKKLREWGEDEKRA